MIESPKSKDLTTTEEIESEEDEWQLVENMSDEAYKKGSPLKAKCWQYFRKAKFTNKDNKRIQVFSICKIKHCEKRYCFLGSTSRMNAHLLNKHEIYTKMSAAEPFDDEYLLMMFFVTAEHFQID